MGQDNVSCSGGRSAELRARGPGRQPGCPLWTCHPGQDPPGVGFGFCICKQVWGVGWRVDESSQFPSNSGCFGGKIAQTQGGRGRGAQTLNAEITPTNLDVHL